jgi:hypothetical protein
MSKFAEKGEMMGEARGGAVMDITFCGDGHKYIPPLQVPRQCPLVPLVEVSLGEVIF